MLKLSLRLNLYRWDTKAKILKVWGLIEISEMGLNSKFETEVSWDPRVRVGSKG